MSWTDERIAVLKKMWKNGSSAADIAKTLGKGVTRNAVIGKAHRMGLSGRPSPIKKPAAPTEKKVTSKTKTVSKATPATTAKAKVAAKSKTAVEEKPAKPTAASKAPIIAGKAKNKTVDDKPLKHEVEAMNISMNTPPKDGGIALIDLTERMCKWPYGDPQEEDFIFCGRTIHPGTPYCPEHAVMAYQTSSKARAASKARAKAAAEEELELQGEINVDDIEDEEVDEDNVGNVD